MTVIAASSPAASRSQSRLNGDFTTVMPAAAGNDGVERARHRHGHGGRDEPAVRDTQRSDGGQAWATLKIKVGETFAALAGTGATSSDAGTSKAGSAAEASGGGSTVSLSLEIKASGSGDAFQGAMKDFVQALYGALQALFNPQAGAASGTKVPTGTATEPIKAAPPDVAAIAPGEPDPTAGAASGVKAAPVDTGATTSAPASLPPATDVDVATPAAPAATTAPARSISVQMRLSYGGGLNGSLGSLVSQLAAQQGAAAADATKSGDAAGGDLAASFRRLLDASPTAAASGTTLGSFLQALARSFGGPASQPPEPVVDTTGDPAGAGSDAQAGSAAGTRYSLAAAYSVVQGDTRMSMAFRVESGPRGPAPIATWA